MAAEDGRAHDAPVVELSDIFLVALAVQLSSRIDVDSKKRFALIAWELFHKERSRHAPCASSATKYTPPRDEALHRRPCRAASSATATATASVRRGAVCMCSRGVHLPRTRRRSNGNVHCVVVASAPALALALALAFAPFVCTTAASSPAGSRQSWSVHSRPRPRRRCHCRRRIASRALDGGNVKRYVEERIVSRPHGALHAERGVRRGKALRARLLLRDHDV